MVNRGYSSASAMFEAYERFQEAAGRGQIIRVIYLGDFDPSGRDMIRDVEERICEFVIGRAEGDSDEDVLNVTEPENWRYFCATHLNFDFEIEPIALSKAQIKQYNPPPNPAKLTDPRAKDYIAEHGNKSWEVDALKPEVLNQILTRAIEKHLDKGIFNNVVKQEQEHRDNLERVRKFYPEVIRIVKESERKAEAKVNKQLAKKKSTKKKK
jgi:hypothetical protein